MKLFNFVLLVLFVLPLHAQSYEGKVVNEVDGVTPIENAKIYFVDIGVTVLSDSLGNWSIDNAPNVYNHIIISAIGFETVHLDIALLAEEMNYLVLHPAHHDLDKVIVSNNGYLHRESITNVESHAIGNLNKIPASTIGQTITNIPGVYQSGLGVGVSKPVIRGLSGSSVVTYVNGLRIQNQQWGQDHGMSVTSIGIGSVEVIKGPASLLFGADAIGGVLYFVDEPYNEKNTISGYASSRFETNSLGVSSQAGVKYSKEKLRFNAHLGFDSYADYQVPNGQQVLNSRFYQASGKFSLGYSKKNWVFNLRYNFYQGRIGLPGHTHDSIPDASSFLTDNQNRGENIPAILSNNHFVSLENKFFFKRNELFITVGNTNNNLKEYEEKFFFPEFVMNLNNTLGNIKLRSKWNRKVETTVGVQGMYQINTNGDAPELLIPDATTLDLGAYSLAMYRSDMWSVLGGIRFDQRILQSDSLVGKNAYSGLNYSIGFARVSDQLSIRLNLSSGFRAPNSNELMSNGVHHGSFRYEVGNQSLISEKAMQIDGSIGMHLNDVELILNPFYNRIRNYIYLEQRDSVINNFQVYGYEQANYAQLYGVDFGFHYHPHHAHWIHVESSFSNVFAEDENKNPLPLIPQTRINNTVVFELAPKSKFEAIEFVVQHKYFFKQNRLGLLESETGDFHLIDLGVNTVLGKDNNLSISFGVRNLLNLAYIDHLSQLKNLNIQNPGRNFYFSIKYELNKSINK